MNSLNAQALLGGKPPLAPSTHPPSSLLTPLLTNQLINIAMETKWQEIAFHQTGAGVIISSVLFVNAL